MTPSRSAAASASALSWRPPPPPRERRKKRCFPLSSWAGGPRGWSLRAPCRTISIATYGTQQHAHMSDCFFLGIHEYRTCNK